MRPDRVVRHADAAIELLDEDRQPGLLAHVLIQKFMTETALGLPARRDLLQRGLALEARAGSSIEKSTLPLLWFKSIDDFDAARARWKRSEERRVGKEWRTGW